MKDSGYSIKIISDDNTKWLYLFKDGAVALSQRYNWMMTDDELISIGVSYLVEIEDTNDF